MNNEILSNEVENPALNKGAVMCRISCTRCNQLIGKDEKHICRDIAQTEWRRKKSKMLEDAGLSVSLIDW